ncbi:hypothetical protein LCGC14_2174970, partial [marine sediment metagenome]
ALGAFVIPCLVLLKPLPGGVAIPLSSFKSAAGLSVAIVLLGMLTHIPWMGIICLFIVAQWWVFGLAKWAMVFLIFFMGWMGWLLACQRVGAKAARLVQWAFLWAAVAQVVFMLMQVHQIDPIMIPIDGAGKHSPHLSQPIVGLFSNPSDVGIFLALILPMALTIGHRLDATFSFLIGLGIALSKSSAALMVGLIIIGLWSIHLIWSGKLSRGWLLGAIPAVGGLWFWFTKIDPLSHSLMRLNIWKGGLTIWKMSPWIGLGPGAMGTKWKFLHEQSLWTMLQNEYLETLFNGGVIGLSLVMMLIFWTAWRCWAHGIQPVLWMGLVAVAVTATVSIPFHIMPTAMVAAWYLGQTWRRDEAI